MNNVDIAIKELRVLQEKILDNRTSNHDAFLLTQRIVEIMQKASIEINTNYAEVSERLTRQLNGKN